MDLVLLDRASPSDNDLFQRREVTVSELLPMQRRVFEGMSPRPVRFYTTYGWAVGEIAGQRFVSAHPDSRLWFSIPPGKRTIVTSYCLMPGSYSGLPPQDATDGVEFAIYEQRADGSRRQVFDRTLQPAEVRGDQGVQNLSLTVDLAAGSELLFETGPGPRKNYNRDWAAWGPITIK